MTPRRLQVVTLSPSDFGTRFGTLDTSQAICGFTSARDTHVVLTLLAHLRPIRILEVGTAAGHMTANLSAWSPPDALVFSLGIVAETRSVSGAAEQQSEIPTRAEFARHANHFGTAHKTLLIAADSRTYDFARIAPLDFCFVDGGHDRLTAQSDIRGAYAALRTGGCLVLHDWGSSVEWVPVREAAAALGLPEPIYHVAGTEVAFLFKGEGVGATADSNRPRVAIAWEGEFEPTHSLATVNRAVCSELVARGQGVALQPSPPLMPVGSRVDLRPELVACTNRPLRSDAVVRHRWPPDFTPPAGTGAFVVCQPWEYGRIPRAWVQPIVDAADEVWVYSRAVERAYVASGVPADRVKVVPLGVDPDRFRPDASPLPLTTTRRVKFLFVGGTIRRKGFDVLLAAYRRAFTAADDVGLVAKDLGADTFYRNQTAGAAIAALQADPSAPAVEYLDRDLSEADLPGLYTACDVLVLPYRGEGFALPVLEAMACGRPVIVTAGGPTDEFVPPSAGWRIPARVAYIPTEEVGGSATAGRPWWLEPDGDALVAALREAAAGAEERATRGAAARRAALGWTWARTAATIEDRVRALRGSVPIRFRRPTAPPSGLPANSVGHSVTITSEVQLPPPRVAGDRPRVSLTMIVKNEEHNLRACLEPVRGLVDEIVVVDTGSTDRTREIAAECGATVVDFPWIDHFAAARNEALQHATGAWAFWLDADDRVDEENARKLAALFASLTDENAAYVMKCLCVADAPGGTVTAVDHVRLFRLDPRHRWRYRVHEQILPSLRQTGAVVRWADVAVRHVGYVDPALRRKKLARDLRLLERERLEHPGDPFALFNLGSVHHELGDYPAAIGALEASLAASNPRDSIVRKLYALLVQCHRKVSDREKALGVCRAGRVHYPDDAELLFLESSLLREVGDAAGAERLLLRLIHEREAEHFGSVDAGLRGHKARHNLACLYLDRGRSAEAESQWRAAVAEEPGFLPAQLGLAELYLREKNWAGVERVAASLHEQAPNGPAEAEALLGRCRIEQGNFEAARKALESAVERYPNSVGVRVAMSYALMRGGAPPEEVEPALQAILALDPDNAQARRNLEVVLRKTGRWSEAGREGEVP